MVAPTKRTPTKRTPRATPRPEPNPKVGARPTAGDATPSRGWTFLTNHAHVLICLAQNESLTARELSQRIGITERSVQAVLSDLIADGYLGKIKIGRRNHYTVYQSGRLRHPVEANHTIAELIDALA